jgi:hypothetical protein
MNRYSRHEFITFNDDAAVDQANNSPSILPIPLMLPVNSTNSI